MKIIFSNSKLSIIFKILFLTPLLLIILIINNPPLTPFYIGIIVFFQGSIFFMFNMVYGFIILETDKIYVSSDFRIFKNSRIQHKFVAKIKDIIAIEFAAENCDSLGQQMRGRYIGSVPNLKLYLNDGSIKRIHLIKFSFRTWRIIELFLLEKNSNILVLRSAKSFKEHFKMGVFKD